MQENTVAPATPSEAPPLNDSQPANSKTGPEPTASPKGSRKAESAASWINWGQIAPVGLLLVLLYLHIGIKLVSDWYTFPDFSHGFLIPFFAVFLLWDQRNYLRNTPAAPSWAGAPVVVLGLIELLVGVLGADLFLQRTSFVVLLAGLIWMLHGRPMLMRLKFVLLVLLLAIPLPTVIYNQVTFPLQILASTWASNILQWIGVPVLRDGNIIQLPAMPLEVAEACSGIRSLMSLFTVAVIYGYFLERQTWRRWVLALSALPIAVTANVARIVGTGLCVQYWDPDKALGFFHDFQGWLMFLVSLGCLYFVHLAMRLMAREGRERA